VPLVKGKYVSVVDVFNMLLVLPAFIEPELISLVHPNNKITDDIKSVFLISTACVIKKVKQYKLKAEISQTYYATP
jgi:hypothetical protein